MDYFKEMYLSDDGTTVLFKRYLFELKLREKRGLKKAVKKFLEENVTEGKKVRPSSFPERYDFWEKGKDGNILARIGIFRVDEPVVVRNGLRFYDVVNGLYIPNRKAEQFLSYVRPKN